MKNINIKFAKSFEIGILCCLFLFASNLSAAERVTIELAIKDHKFIPEKIEAPADKVIVLIVSNLDETAEEFESFELKREKIIPAKSKAKIVLSPLKPGEYKFFGDFYAPRPEGVLIVK